MRNSGIFVELISHVTKYVYFIVAARNFLSFLFIWKLFGERNDSKIILNGYLYWHLSANTESESEYICCLYEKFFIIFSEKKVYFCSSLFSVYPSGCIKFWGLNCWKIM